MIRKLAFVVCLAWAASLGAMTWTNPILPMDFSDPDVCIGRDGRAYMTASSFGDIPGLPILVSDNMVNWTYIGYALRQQPYPEGIGSPEHGKSVYAPSIRYNARKDEYVIYWGDPWHGVYRVAAKDPAGEWSAPRLVVEGVGLIDTCPLYDDDGRADRRRAASPSTSAFPARSRGPSTASTSRTSRPSPRTRARTSSGPRAARGSAQPSDSTRSRTTVRPPRAAWTSTGSASRIDCDKIGAS